MNVEIVEIQAGENDKNKLLHDLDIWFRHSETIGQTRLSNFLTVETFLLAACAFLLDKKPVENAAIFIIALLGAAFSIFSYFLGTRQKKFHQYIERVADDVVVVREMAHGEQKNSVFAIVREFQHGNHRKEDKPSKYDPNLNIFEHFFSSRRFLVIGPILYFVCFLSLAVFVIFKP